MPQTPPNPKGTGTIVGGIGVAGREFIRMVRSLKCSPRGRSSCIMFENELSGTIPACARGIPFIDVLCEFDTRRSSAIAPASPKAPTLGALPPASLQSCASDLQGWRKCRRLSGTIPACARGVPFIPQGTFSTSSWSHLVPQGSLSAGSPPHLLLNIKKGPALGPTLNFP